MPFDVNIVYAILGLIIGFLILIKSADILVDGAVALASQFGISPFVIGLTIVAMGTSAPEVAASICAALKNAGDVAVGNVYGSNIANLALIGGITALISPIAVTSIALKRELPAMLITALLLWPLLYNLSVNRCEALLLIAVFSGLIVYTVHSGFKNRSAVIIHGPSLTGPKIRPLKISLLFIILGLIGLAVGAEITIRSAVYMGQAFGLSQAVIGLTIIAFGTSLPELVTCVVAALKKQDDISIGNLVGSNVFNTLLVIGCAGLAKPFSIGNRLIGTDYWAMIGFSTLFFMIILLKKRISRISGAILFLCYLSYLIYLFAITPGT